MINNGGEINGFNILLSKQITYKSAKAFLRSERLETT
jgi:hypothetical protein